MKDITRRQFILNAASTATVAGLTGCTTIPETGENAQARPNVLFIFADQLRADACSVYGGKNIETPHIDRLAAQGMRFTNALSTYPLCTPFRGMLQTGRYPMHSGILINFIDVDPNQRCIGHVFNDAGYDTGFIGKWHLSAGWRKREGKYRPNRERVLQYHRQNPETEFDAPGPHRLGFRHWEGFNFHTDFNNYWFYRDEPEKIYSGKYETDTQIDQAIAYMKRHEDGGRPFFLMVAPHPPHPPFKETHVPTGYLERISENLHFSPNVPENHPRRADPLEVRTYYAMCKNLDDNLGRIMDYLHESGLAGNTIVVLTSDHGDQHGSHNRINKMVPYAESIDVPLIIRWPGYVPAGVVSDALFTPMDHLATLCGMVGLDVPETSDGMDLSSALIDKVDIGREAVLLMTCSSHWDFFQTGTLWPEWRGVSTRRYTYCKWLAGGEELYDNLTDPYQMRNLVEKDPGTLKKMRTYLKALMAEAHDEFLPGDQYGEWFDDERRLLRAALGRF